MKYIVLICGGLGDKVWDKEVEIEAENFKEAVEKVYKDKPYNSDIVEMKQQD